MLGTVGAQRNLVPCRDSVMGVTANRSKFDVWVQFRSVGRISRGKVAGVGRFRGQRLGHLCMKIMSKCLMY